MNPGIVSIDLHGRNTYQTKIAVDAALRRANSGTYRLRLIHGYHGGTQLQTMIRKVYRRHPRVLRLELGLNPGETELVLREY